MSFWKRLFNPGKRRSESENPDGGDGVPGLSAIMTTTAFRDRFKKEDINAKPDVLDGCLKMVKSYFMDNNIEMPIPELVTHPKNLDQTMDEGMGFALYCQAFKMAESEAGMFLAYAFSDYLIQHYGFELYTDQKPEYPLRGMTLKYDKSGTVLSLYPFEYSMKVLNHQASFSGMIAQLDAALPKLPDTDDLLNNL